MSKVRFSPYLTLYLVSNSVSPEVSSTPSMKASVRINRGVESLFGTRDENIRLIESGLNVHTQLVDNSLEIEGEAEGVARAENILEDYNALVPGRPRLQ